MKKFEGVTRVCGEIRDRRIRRRNVGNTRKSKFEEILVLTVHIILESFDDVDKMLEKF